MSSWQRSLVMRSSNVSRNENRFRAPGVIVDSPCYSAPAVGCQSLPLCPSSLCSGCTSVWWPSMTARMLTGELGHTLCVCMCAHTAADTNANTHTHTLTAMDSNPVICPQLSPTRKAFSILKLWVNWFMVLIIISALLTIYCTLLLVRHNAHTCQCIYGMSLTSAEL